MHRSVILNTILGLAKVTFYQRATQDHVFQQRDVSLTFVHHLVSLQNTQPQETLPADGTLVWFVFAVDLQVDPQAGRRGERLAALRTAVRSVRGDCFNDNVTEVKPLQYTKERTAPPAHTVLGIMGNSILTEWRQIIIF